MVLPEPQLVVPDLVEVRRERDVAPKGERGIAPRRMERREEGSRPQSGRHSLHSTSVESGNATKMCRKSAAESLQSPQPLGIVTPTRRGSRHCALALHDNAR